MLGATLLFNVLIYDSFDEAVAGGEAGRGSESASGLDAATGCGA